MKPVNGGAVSNTVIEYELADGTVVPLTFTWGHMVHVQATEKGVYKRFSRALMAGENPERHPERGARALRGLPVRLHPAERHHLGQHVREGVHGAGAERPRLRLRHHRRDLPPKSESGLRGPFLDEAARLRRRLKDKGPRVSPPEFRIATVEDAYTYYVLILGMSEDLFWGADTRFLEAVAANKAAYDTWLEAARGTMRKEAEKRHGKAKR